MRPLRGTWRRRSRLRALWASVPQAEEAAEDGWRCPLREDAEEPSLPQEEILQNAPSRADGYFLLEDRG